MTDLFFPRKLGLPAAVLLSVAGCSQILGLSDYEIDSDEEGAGGAMARAGSPARGGNSAAGNSAEGGATSGGDGSAGDGSAGDGSAGDGSAGDGSAGGAQGGAGGASGGEIVPCDSADCCETEGGTPVGVELFSDGGFEQGPVVDGNSPWKETSVKGFPLITDGISEGVDPHAGAYFAFLAGLASEQSDLNSPTINVPANAGWMVISGFRWFELDSVLISSGDFCGLALYDPASVDALEIPFFWDSSDPAATTRWTHFEGSWDAAPHAGKKRYFKFRGSTDAFADKPSFPASNYLFDDVSLKSFVCTK